MRILVLLAAIAMPVVAWLSNSGTFGPDNGTISDRYLFFAFWTDGKTNRVVAAREMSEAEQKFYDRKYAEFR